MSGEASSHGIMNQGFITSLRLNEYHKSQQNTIFCFVHFWLRKSFIFIKKFLCGVLVVSLQFEFENGTLQN